MTPAEFSAWLDARGWSKAEAARRLGVQPSRITEWLAGVDSAGNPRRVPAYVRKHLDTLDRLAECEARSP
jgi:transcriptional regulator with XRE-family HTH domain